jgi:hypothetical protein
MEVHMIQAVTDLPDNVIGFVCRGHLTRQDYEAVVIPTVEATLKQHQKVRLYFQIDPDFHGMDPGAMWEDFKLGTQDAARWERIALVTDIEWIRNGIRLFAFLVPGEIQSFPLSQADKAREWVSGDPSPATPPHS